MQGPKGVLEKKLPPLVRIKIEGTQLLVEKDAPQKKLQNKAKAFQGLAWALINNMITGVTKGFTKSLDIVGLGYKAEVKGQEIVFSLGYSHPINFPLPRVLQQRLRRGQSRFK